MKCSEITLDDVIKRVDSWCPVKIIFNNMILYNDYDSEVEITNEIYGEVAPPLSVVPDRIKKFEKSIVTSINIEIVEHHHSIVTIQGEFKYVK